MAERLEQCATRLTSLSATPDKELVTAVLSHFHTAMEALETKDIQVWFSFLFQLFV